MSRPSHVALPSWHTTGPTQRRTPSRTPRRCSREAMCWSSPRGAPPASRPAQLGPRFRPDFIQQAVRNLDAEAETEASEIAGEGADTQPATPACKQWTRLCDPAPTRRCGRASSPPLTKSTHESSSSGPAAALDSALPCSAACPTPLCSTAAGPVLVVRPPDPGPERRLTSSSSRPADLLAARDQPVRSPWPGLERVGRHAGARFRPMASPACNGRGSHPRVRRRGG